MFQRQRNDTLSYDRLVAPLLLKVSRLQRQHHLTRRLLHALELAAIWLAQGLQRGQLDLEQVFENGLINLIIFQIIKLKLPNIYFDRPIRLSGQHL